MTLLEAIDLVVAHTGVKRYRYLCLEHPKPTVRAAYGDLVLRLAAEPTTARLSAAESMDLLKAIRACPFRSLEAVPTGCGCSHCGLRNGARVSHLDCLTCVKTYG
jgi:hypothetical protein